jgi:hypothetical protein
MFSLDDDFLQSLGLGDMPDDQKQAFLQHLYEELELRVGTRLSEGMSDTQLAEFEKLIDNNDEQGALHWLETNRPNYKDVVAEELDKLKQEVITNRDQIVGGAEEPAQA